jgi:hypothetical protein
VQDGGGGERHREGCILERAEAEARGRNKAAGTGIEPAAGGGKAKPAGARRTKLVQVGQQYMDRLREERAVNPRRSLPASPETIASAYKDKPKARDEILRLDLRQCRLCHEGNDGEGR